jgi:3'(2'), 5'-bisphosphate nucleotidase
MASKTPDIQQIVTIAKLAGDAIVPFYTDAIDAQEKEDKSFLTDADIASEKILLSELKEFGIPIVSEESFDAKDKPSGEFLWFVDPLDGTNDFILRTDEFAVMIGLTHKGAPILGVLYEPISKTVYYAQKDKGAFVQREGEKPEKLHIGQSDTLVDAQLLVSRTHLTLKEQLFLKKIGFKHIIPKGSIGVKAGLIGEADLYFTFTDKTSLWDSCAPLLLIQEAGGIMSDINGKALQFSPSQDIKNSNGIACGSPKLHKQLIDALKNNVIASDSPTGGERGNPAQ